MPGLSDVRDLIEKHLPYGEPNTYDFPTMNVLPGDVPNSDDPAARTGISVFSALRDYGDNPPCAKGRLQVQLVGKDAEPTPAMAPMDKTKLENDSLHLVFKTGGTAYRITKGIRIPYTYKDINGATVHTNLFILFSGAGQA